MNPKSPSIVELLLGRLEHKREPLLHRRAFAGRMARTATLALGLGAGWLGVGVLGYRTCEGMDWIDALLNAAMIMTSMGPAERLATVPGKLFATGYALASGFVVLTVVAVVMAPLIHRLLHRFHLDVQEEPAGVAGGGPGN